MTTLFGQDGQGRSGDRRSIDSALLGFGFVSLAGLVVGLAALPQLPTWPG